MPETPDWSAPPEAVVSVSVSTIVAAEAGGSLALGVSTAGRVIVIVGLDVHATSLDTDTTALRGMVSVAVLDSLTGLRKVGTAVSPESPAATVRPPFGSVRTSTGADLNIDTVSQAGAGNQAVAVTVYYYAE